MIVRIVRMHFRPDAVAAFEELFDIHKEQIRSQDGCSLLELYQDKEDHCSFYTYSYWKSEEALNNYRHSALFSEVWPATKALFDQKPTANSLNKIHSLL
ncbi:antibiotic biosynthesis monooxygenase [Nonlabens mediterrranea]|uniref:Antibiotic biosynthesis monooxygenase n=1 Tax=Nonlabens mediterrranea TaxID=1419947 RepID=A0ABS0A5T6_9FLAO|nr:antibiotic biosynthesis monooxygenase [Nonlabens mediterrranea]